MKEKLLTTKNVVLMGMFGALAGVLMVFEVPLPFLAPSFYGLDISEVPVLVGSFALGPVAGVVTEVVKILVKLVIKPTSTGFVGELANLTFGCAMVVPAGLIYKLNRTRKGAVLGLAAGTALMTVAAVIGNALVMLPFYSNFMPLDTIIAAGAAINPAVSNIWSFVIICVGPFNVLKGVVVSVITALVYKRISAVIHNMGNEESGKLRSRI
ncbi:MAG: ECF transporter S component [Eubacteriales bacterium]|nr:ECF transporter S component [Eubacteriales bacterium]